VRAAGPCRVWVVSSTPSHRPSLGVPCGWQYPSRAGGWAGGGSDAEGPRRDNVRHPLCRRLLCRCGGGRALTLAASPARVRRRLERGGVYAPSSAAAIWPPHQPPPPRARLRSVRSKAGKAKRQWGGVRLRGRGGSGFFPLWLRRCGSADRWTEGAPACTVGGTPTGGGYHFAGDSRAFCDSCCLGGVLSRPTSHKE